MRLTFWAIRTLPQTLQSGIWKEQIIYQDTLGMTPVVAEGQEVVVSESGNSKANVYLSQYI
jgi:hypothetical protein